MTKAVQVKRELVFERKRPGSEPPLAITEPPPVATPENSWLTFADPKGRYHLRHPQEFQPKFFPDSPDSVTLARFRPDGSDDLLGLTYVANPRGRPEEAFKQRIEDWRKEGVEVLPGLSEKLPDAEWPGMAIYHMEAALTNANEPGRPAVRRYYDAYEIQFSRNVNLIIAASTFLDDPSPFRAQVRAMLKTIKLGAPKEE